MGNKLLDYFNKADEIGGLPAKIRLAALSKSSSLQAKTMEDSLENIQSMQKSFEVLSQEFDKRNPVKAAKAIDYTARDTIKSLRGYIKAFSDVILAQSKQDTLELASQQITTVIAESIYVNRASVWFYNEDESGMVCINLYERNRELHSQGAILRKSDYPEYFKTLATNRTLVADDVRIHPGTIELVESYMIPHGITSMLDVPIFANGKMVGLICHEHTGPKRNWTSDEENFAYLMGNILSNSFKNR
ncbi:MAG: GAF domain-containing protein [Aureispira sp.]